MGATVAGAVDLTKGMRAKERERERETVFNTNDFIPLKFSFKIKWVSFLWNLTVKKRKREELFSVVCKLAWWEVGANPAK